MNRSIEPNLAEWIITGCWRVPSAATYSRLKRSVDGWLKSYWMVDICQVRPIASRACTEILGP